MVFPRADEVHDTFLRRAGSLYLPQRLLSHPSVRLSILSIRSPPVPFPPELKQSLVIINLPANINQPTRRHRLRNLSADAVISRPRPRPRPPVRLAATFDKLLRQFLLIILVSLATFVKTRIIT